MLDHEFLLFLKKLLLSEGALLYVQYILFITNTS